MKYVISPIREEDITIQSRITKSPKPFLNRNIHDKYNFVPKNKIKYTNNNKLILHDLSCTLSINLKEISNIKKIDSLSFNQMEILQKKISIISELFKNVRKNYKNKNKLKSKIFMNNQLIEDIKKKTDEEKMILQIKKNRLIKVIDAKEIEINQYKQKFNEIENFVKRACQMDEKYKKKYSFFSIDTFILNNMNLLQLIKEKKQKNDYIMDLINVINYENKEYKNVYNKENIYINNNERISITRIKNNINDFLSIQNDKNKYFEDYIDIMNKVYKNIYNIELITTYGLDKFKQNKDKNSLLLPLYDNKNSNLFKSGNESTSNICNDYQNDSSELSSDSEKIQ